MEQFKNKYSQSGSFDVKKEVDFMTQMNLYNTKNKSQYIRIGRNISSTSKKVRKFRERGSS